MSDAIFVDGLFIEKPKEGAPDFVKAKVSVNVDKLTAWCAQHKNEKGYVNIDLLKSKGGKLYFAKNTFGAEKKVEETPDNPFGM